MPRSSASHPASECVVLSSDPATSQPDCPMSLPSETPSEGGTLASSLSTGRGRGCHSVGSQGSRWGSDPGVCSRIDTGSYCTTSNGRCGRRAGTPLYASPEVLGSLFRSRDSLGGECAVGPKNDIWAVGVMALEAISGHHPFCNGAGGANTNMLHSIATHSSIALPEHLSPELADWFTKALQRDPSKRHSAPELLHHSWFRKCYSQERQQQQQQQGGRQHLTVASRTGAVSPAFPGGGGGGGADGGRPPSRAIPSSRVPGRNVLQGTGHEQRVECCSRGGVDAGGGRQEEHGCRSPVPDVMVHPSSHSCPSFFQAWNSQVPLEDINCHRVTSHAETADSQHSMFDLYRWLLGAPESPSSPTPSSPTQQQSPADVQGLSSLHASRSSRASDLGESQQGLDPDLLQKRF
ncbi:MAG: hypothetical protein WDW38_000014 [Sanguina aurantia]